MSVEYEYLPDTALKGCMCVTCKGQTCAKCGLDWGLTVRLDGLAFCHNHREMGFKVKAAPEQVVASGMSTTGNTIVIGSAAGGAFYENWLTSDSTYGDSPEVDRLKAEVERLTIDLADADKSLTEARKYRDEALALRDLAIETGVQVTGERETLRAQNDDLRTRLAALVTERIFDKTGVAKPEPLIDLCDLCNTNRSETQYHSPISGHRCRECAIKVAGRGPKPKRDWINWALGLGAAGAMAGVGAMAWRMWPL